MTAERIWKITRRVLLWIVASFLALQLLLFALLQIPAVQTWLTERVVSTLSGNISGEIEIGRIHYKIFNTLTVEEVAILSNERSELLDSLKEHYHQTDTLLYVKRLDATLNIWDLFDNKLSFKEIALKGGAFNLQTEEGKSTNLERILNLEKSEAKRDKKPSKLIVTAERFRATDLRFTLNNPNKMRLPEQRDSSVIDFADMCLKEIEVSAENLRIEGNRISASVKNICATDKSGYSLKHLSGEFTIGDGKALMKGMTLQDNLSTINAEQFYFGFKTPKSFANFCDSVIIHLDTRSSYFNFGTIGYIRPEFKSNSTGLYFSGTVEGPVSDLRSELLNVSLEDGITNLSLSFSLNGLPDAKNTLLEGELLRGFTNAPDVAKIIAQFGGDEENPAIKGFAPLKTFNISGEISGLFNRLNFRTIVRSSGLRLNSNILYENFPEHISISGSASIAKMELTKMLPKSPVGSLKGELGAIEIISRKKAAPGEALTIKAEGIKIDELKSGGYDYSNILANAEYSRWRSGKGLADIRIECSDPSLKLSAEAFYAEERGDKSIKVPYLKVTKADLCALNLMQREDGAAISLNGECNLSLSKEGYINGEAKIGRFLFSNSSGVHNIGDILITSNQGAQECRMVVDADFADILFTGNSTLQNFVSDMLDSSPQKDISNFNYTRLLSANPEINRELKREPVGQRDQREHSTNRNRWDGRHYNIDITTHNSNNLMELVAPELFIQPGTVLDLDYSDTDFIVNLTSGRVGYSGESAKGIDLRLESTDTTNTLKINTGEITFNNIKIDRGELDLYAQDNRAELALRLKEDSASTTLAELKLSSIIESDWSIRTAIKESFFHFAQKRWRISPSSVEITDTTKIFHNISISNNSQNLKMDGILSQNSRDSLDFSMENFDLSILNILSGKRLGIKGSLSGEAKLCLAESNPKAELDLYGEEVFFMDAPVGRIHLSSNWDKASKRLEFTALGGNRDYETLNLSGFYSPKSDSISAHASLNSFPIDFAEPFLEGIISNFTGTISGEYSLGGTLQNPDFRANGCKFNNFGFNVDFTGVNYRLNGPFRAERGSINLNKLEIKDRYGNSGLVNGTITHNYLRNINLDLHIFMNNMESLNTYGEGNPVFYGKAFTTGEVSITGPLNKIQLSPQIATNQGTSIHIPLIMGQSSAKTTDLLTFKEPEVLTQDEEMEEAYLKAKEKRESKSKNELSVLFRGDIRPEATLFLEIDKAAGDILRVNGNGNIAINVVPSTGFFTIKGDYTVSQGSYRFVLANMLTRDFTIQDGGRILFNGDIAKSRLDLTAIYKVKTSINTLINDTVSVGTRRNVYCKLGITGTLTSPVLKFGIEIPDLDPTTNLKVESALKNEESIQRQFAALLVYGGFAQVNNNSGSNINLYSNVSGILSGQLNYLMQHLGIPVGLGVDYNQDSKGKGLYDVSLSTQLFNNRVMVNGNIGNSPYSSQNGSSVVGNIDVEIKLDEKGRIRLNLFSHAPDKYSNYLDDSQRSGAGILYQKEFNSFRELFRKRSKEEKAYLKELKANRKRLRKEMRNAK